MVPNDGWYLIGPLLAVGLVVLLGALLQRTLDRDGGPRREAYADGLAILDGPAAPDLFDGPDEPALFDGPAAPGGPALFDGLAALGRVGQDYGLLRPAALTDDPWLADDIRRLLVDAGIRATHAVRPDGRVVVLVFDSEVEEARRLVGDSPVL